MIIKRIELTNFRIYKGHHSIDLLPEEGKNIVIISGKNGFGKTTFLMSLVWCLYGRQMVQVDEIYQKEVNNQGGYGRYISKSLNNAARNDGETQFSVTLVFQDVDIPGINCKELTVTRTFDVNTSANDEVTILIDGHHNELTEEVGEEHFIRDFILPKEVAKFFFFDAEKIVTLAEVNNAEERRSLSSAYSEVLGIQKYEDLRHQLEGFRNKIRAESASIEEQRKLRNIESETQSALEDIEAKENQIQEIEESVAQLKDDSNRLQEKLIRAGSIITIEELEALRTREKQLEDDLKEIQGELRDSMEIIPFAIAGANMADMFLQIGSEIDFKKAAFEQEKVAEVTDKIIDDLAEQKKPEGVVISHQVRRFFEDTIKDLIKKHFFANVKEIPEGFQTLHEYSETEYNELSALLNNLKLTFKEKFKSIVGNYNVVKNELNGLRRKVSEAEGKKENPLIEEDRKKREEIEGQIRVDLEKIGALKTEIENLKQLKINNEKAIESISKKLKASKKNEEKDKVASRLIKELQVFINDFKAEKKKSLEKKVLEGLNTLMHKKGFIKSVKVDIIGEDIDLTLQNAAGNEILKSSLSMGEKQLYATALLYGLVEESDIEFPLFIDSPMQKLDAAHAKNIIEFFYPNISKQVIVFPLIKKEMTKEEYDILLPHIAKSYLIENIEREHSKLVQVDKPKELFDRFEEIEVNYAD